MNKIDFVHINTLLRVGRYLVVFVESFIRKGFVCGVLGKFGNSPKILRENSLGNAAEGQGDPGL